MQYLRAKVLLVLACTICYAASPRVLLAEDYYERGLRAYQSGDFMGAEQAFALAIGEDLFDPRPYYFRGLARHQTGRTEAAQDDLLVGATVEAQARGRYAVRALAKSLSAADQTLLQQYRNGQSENDAAATSHIDPQGYQQGVAAILHSNTGRQRVIVPLEKLIGPVSVNDFEIDPRPPAPLSAAARKPFSPLSATGQEDSASASLLLAGEDATDPFEDDQPSEVDTRPSTPKESDLDEAAIDEDPFGDDPFGEL